MVIHRRVLHAQLGGYVVDSIKEVRRSGCLPSIEYSMSKSSSSIIAASGCLSRQGGFL